MTDLTYVWATAADTTECVNLRKETNFLKQTLTEEQAA